MNRTLIALPFIVALAGCAGSIDRNNIYAGNWGGNYVDSTRPDTGALELDIASDGTMTGQVTRDSDGENGTFTGVIDQSGQFTGVVDFATGGDFESMDGSITYSSSQTLGNFHYLWNDDWTNATFELVPMSD